MGLFGYRKKTFYKNTEMYKSKLHEIFLRESKFKPEESLRDVIFNLIQLLDLVSFPQKANSKVQRTIDNYIFHLIDELEAAVIENKKTIVLSLLSIMSDVISDCRRTGELSHLAQQNFHKEEKRAQYREEIESIIEQKEDITRKKHEILKEAVNEREKTEKLRLEYSMLEEKEKHLDKTLKQLIEAYSVLGGNFERTIVDEKISREIKRLQPPPGMIRAEEPIAEQDIQNLFLDGFILEDYSSLKDSFDDDFKKYLES